MPHHENLDHSDMVIANLEQDLLLARKAVETVRANYEHEQQENARLREALSKIHNLLWHCIGLTEQDNKWIQEAFKEEGEE